MVSALLKKHGYLAQIFETRISKPYARGGELVEGLFFVNAFWHRLGRNSARYYRPLACVDWPPYKHNMIRNYMFLFVSAALLGGCGTIEGEFPSLAKRPFESQSPASTSVTPVLEAASMLPTDIDRAVAALINRHQKAQDKYISLLPSVQAQAKRAAGSAIGSEIWVNAHLELSRLDKARSDSVAALAEMDALLEKRIDAESLGAMPSLIALLEPKQRLLVAAVSEQSTELERLTNLIGL